MTIREYLKYESHKITSVYSKSVVKRVNFIEKLNPNRAGLLDVAWGRAGDDSAHTF